MRRAGSRNPRLLPVDEARVEAGFLAVSSAAAGGGRSPRCRRLSSRRCDPGIRLGFDASGGVDAFRKLFGERSESWEELRSRARARRQLLVADVVRGTLCLFRLAGSIRLVRVCGGHRQERSSSNGSAAGCADHHRGQLLDRPAAEPDATSALWSHVRLGDGRTGYIWHAYVRSPIDYRALFNLSTAAGG